MWPPTRHSLLARLADPECDVAWREFLGIYEPAIYRYARSRGLQVDDAREVVQEVLLALHAVLPDWKPTHQPGSFRAWLAEAARRITLQTLRKSSRVGRGTGGSDMQSALAEAPAGSLDWQSEEDFRRWAFFAAAAEVERGSSEIAWQAFWRTSVNGDAPEEVARELGLSVGAVYTAKCRILAKIKQRVTKLVGDDT